MARSNRPRFVSRLGLALVRPRWALALADDPADAGRAGTDLALVLLALIVGAHARELFAAGWLAVEIEATLGLRTIVDVVARAVTTPLAFLLLAAAATFVLAGPRRALGRDFDLACVAVLPVVVVELAATLVVRIADVHVPPAASWAIAGVGFAWAGALVALAVAQARRRSAGPSGAAAHVPDDARRTARRAGAGVVALLAAVLVVDATWIARHVDWLRPMDEGDTMKRFALPRIEAGGALGAPVRSEELAQGVVVLDFWATWCKPCRDALPSLSSLAERGAGKLTVLSINLDDAAEARRMFDEHRYRSILVADAGGAAEHYGVSTIPHLVVIEDGVVRLVARGGNHRQVIGVAEELAGLHGPHR